MFIYKSPIMSREKTNFKIKIIRNTFLIAILWFAIISSSLYINIRNKKEHTNEIAAIEARAIFNKDLSFRLWAASHGGAYVPVTDITTPNPNLSHIRERDILTPSGKKLTLMNPAYMMRQIMAFYEDIYGAKGKITSLNCLNPINNPDEWEKTALQRFKNGEKEIFEISKLNGKEYLRLLTPLYAKKDCLKCHYIQGYNVGDLIGGIGVSVPIDKYRIMEASFINSMFYHHFIIFSVGLIAIIFAARKAQKGLAARAAGEHQLMESRTKYRSLTENSTDLIIRLSEDYQIIFANSSFKNILNNDINPSDGIDLSIIDLKEPETLILKEKTDNVFNTARKDEANIKLDHKIYHFRFIPELNDLGQIDSVLCIGRDISTLKETENSLRLSEDILKRAQTIAHIGSWYSGDEGAVSISNEIKNLYEIPMDKEIKNIEELFKFIHEDDIEIFNRKWAEAKNSGFLDFEHRISINNKIKWVREKAEIKAGESNDSYKGIGVIHDITQKKLGENQIVLLNAELEQKVHERTILLQDALEELKFENEERRRIEKDLREANHSKDKFFSIIGHDLNNPMQVLLSSSELLKRNLEKGNFDKVNSHVEKVINTSYFMRELLGNLLTWARIQTGRVDFEPEEFNLNVLAAESIERVKALAFNKQISVKSFLVEEYSVFADRSMVENILQNLLTNAIKFSSESGNIKVYASEKDFYIEISVIDNGIGIAENDLHKIFRIDTHHSIKGTNNETGTGLGLILTKEFVEINKGTVRVESEPGIGSSFSFTLPKSHNNAAPPGNESKEIRNS